MRQGDRSFDADELLLQSEWLRRLARRLAGEGADADDLAQDAWLSALTATEKPRSPRAYLAEVLRRRLTDLRRAEKRRRSREETHAQRCRGDEDSLERLRRQRAIVDELLALPDEYRRVLVLRYFEGLAPRNIAKRIGVPIETIRSRLKRGLALLRLSVRRRQGDAEAGKTFALVGALALGSRAARASSLTALAGGLLMSVVTKIVLGLTALVLLVALFWGFRLGSAGPDDEVLEKSTVEASAGEAAARREVGESREEGEASAPAIENSATNDPVTEVSTAAAPVASGRISGRVLDLDGRPVADASVYLEKTKAGVDPRFHDARDLLWALQNHMTPVAGARTDVEGRFSIGCDIAESELAHLAAWHDRLGVGVRVGIVVKRSGADGLDVSLSGGVVIRGRIMSESAGPLAGARIQISAGDASGNYGTHLTVESDVDGYYVTLPIPGVSFFARAQLDGYRSGRSPKLVPAEIGRGEIVHDFTLPAARRLKGRLLRPDGQLFVYAEEARRVAPDTEGEWVMANRLQVFVDFSDPELETDYFSMGHTAARTSLEESRFEIALDSNSYRWLSAWCGTRFVGKVEIPTEGDEPDLVIDPAKLPPPDPKTSLSLTILQAEDGKPVGTCDCFVTTMQTSNQPGSRTTYSPVPDATGRRTIEGLKPGRVRLALQAAGRAGHCELLDLQVDPRDNDRTIRLAAATGRIVGRVVDRENRPLPRASIHLLDLHDRLLVDPWILKVRCDENGRFQIGELAEGRARLAAEHPGFAPVVVEVDTEPGAPEAVIVLEPGEKVLIEPAGADGPFSFIFRDATGRALVDDSRTGTTRHGSGWEFMLPPGRLTLETQCPGFDSQPLEFDPRSDKVLKPQLVRRPTPPG